MRYESLFVDAGGRTARGLFIGALIPLLLAGAFYHLWVFGKPGQFAGLLLFFPAFVLHARRLHDMGRSAWPLALPVAAVAAAAWFHILRPEEAAAGRPVIYSAIAICAVFTLWGLIGAGEAGTNRYGEPVG
jgi:uncharacterized membrane protein YhaH (DUF805 family)